MTAGDRRGLPLEISCREFIEIGNEKPIWAVPLHRSVERAQRRTALETPCGASGIQLETTDSFGIGEFQSVELPRIGAMGKSDLSVGIQQRAGYEAGPWNIVAVKTWLEAQDLHGLEAWRGLIMAVLTCVSRTANSFEVDGLIPS